MTVKQCTYLKKKIIMEAGKWALGSYEIYGIQIYYFKINWNKKNAKTSNYHLINTVRVFLLLLVTKFNLYTLFIMLSLT